MRPVVPPKVAGQDTACIVVERASKTLRRSKTRLKCQSLRPQGALEQDDSLIESDRRVLYERVRVAGCEHTLRYEHKAAHEECLLAIPDAVAWCWAKGGEWRRRAEPIVAEICAVKCR